MDKVLKTLAYRIARMKLDGASKAKVLAILNPSSSGFGTDVKIKITKKVIRALMDTLQESRKAVVVLGRTGKIRVYSLTGHKAASAHAMRTKPWENAKTARKDITKRGTPRKVRQYTHWTQRLTAPQKAALSQRMIVARAVKRALSTKQAEPVTTAPIN